MSKKPKSDAKTAKPEKSKKKSPETIKNDDLIRVANDIAVLWMEFRKAVRMAYGNKPIGRPEEEYFLELKSKLARQHRVLGQRMPANFHYGARGMKELMGQTISLGALRDLPMPDKKGIYQKWHAAHINMQHLMGILDLLGEGHEVKFETVKQKTGNIKADMAGNGNSKKKKSGSKKKMVFVVVVLVAAAAIYLYMNR